ncbi:MAG: cation transporter [Chloroflexi bacterium]|nr:cation transporter [Chloroflexota bacterium]
MHDHAGQDQTEGQPPQALPARTGARQAQARRPLVLAAAVVAAYLVVEVAGALISGSLALLADAAHTASDVGALGLALFASWAAGRPASPERSFGYLRAEVLAAVVNGAALLVIAAVIFGEAAERIGSPPEVRGGVVSIVASGGIAANVVAAVLLLRSSRTNMAVRAALFHVGGDALGSAGAVVAGLLVVAFGWHAADPIVSVFIGLLLVVAAVRVLREATHVLLEGTPAHVDLMALRDDIEGMADVEGCHDLHTWTIASGYHALSAHVTICDDCAGQRVRELQGRLRSMVSETYGIAHVTIQLERSDGACVEEGHVPAPAAGARPR